MLSVQIVLFEGFDLLDAIAPYEVFSAASMMTENMINLEFVTAEGPRLVASGINGIQLEAHGKLDPGRAGLILVPGASGDVQGDGPDSVPAILSRAVHTGLTGCMEQALGQRDIIVATVCGGSLVLAMAGLLEGRPAVTNHLGMELLGATGAIPIWARVVDDGNLVTGGGVTSGLDVALYLLERELGPMIAHEVERLFEFERRGTVWRQSGMAPGSGSSSLNAPSDDKVSLAQDQQNRFSLRPDPITQASIFDGDWDTSIETPVGKLQVKLSITTSQGKILGKATQGNETVEFINPQLVENRMTWSLQIRKPMRLNLMFEVYVRGDQMTGTARAGMLPASKLTGERVL